MRTETPLQRAERYVREGERRLIHQKALIARLEGNGDAAPLRAALLLLSQMEDHQRLSIEHLDHERVSLGGLNTSRNRAISGLALL